jgi:hypothetical protein
MGPVDFGYGAQQLGSAVGFMAISKLSPSERFSEIWQEFISKIGPDDMPDRDWFIIEEMRKKIRSKHFALDVDCINSFTETEIKHIITDLVSITFDVKVAHGIRIEEGN